MATSLRSVRIAFGAPSAETVCKNKNGAVARAVSVSVSGYSAALHQPRLINGICMGAGDIIIGGASGCSIQRRPILKSQEDVSVRL